MKKKLDYNSIICKKIKSIMKIVTILLFAGIIHVSATTYAQNQRISVKVENGTFYDLVSQIETQSEFMFFYNSDDIDNDMHINIKAKNRLITDILNEIAKNNDFMYKVSGKHIIITKAAPAPQPSRKQVSGTVVDETGEPVAGAGIVEKGTTNGTSTDMDGRFVLSVLENAVLQVSYIGYISQEVPVGNQSSFTVTLSEDFRKLDEVVIVGYGTMRKIDLTGSSSSVKDGELGKRTATSFGQILAGHASGVNIATNSGRPGGRTTIRIRGNSSISVTNDPLYVVDGVILNVSSLSNGTSPIDYLNPNDIESIEILKDASSTAIYGARGANGVVLITTKRGDGAVNGATVSYESSFSASVLPAKLELLNAAEFLRIEETGYANAQKYDPEGWARGAYSDPRLKRTDPRLFDDAGNPLYDTDWQDEAIRDAFSQSHRISASNTQGGNSYGLSFGYRDEDGIIHGSWLKRYSGRIFVDTKVSNWLKVGGSVSYNYQKERQTDEMGNGGITMGRQIVEALPILPVRYDDGTYSGNRDYPGMEGGDSPVRVADQRNYMLETQNMIGNVYTNITFMEGLELRSLFGTNIINQRTNLYSSRELVWISAPNGSAYINDGRNISWQFENYLTYNRVFAEKHSLNAMLGLSWQHVGLASVLASAGGFDDDFYQYNNLGIATDRSVGSSASAYGLNSYFARLNYGYMSKYLLTLTARADGSSKFGASNRYAFFPSVGVAWRMKEEEFLQPVDFLSNLKLRASYGITGNSETGPYASQGQMGSYTVVFGTTKVPALGVASLANPVLQWEKTAQSNVGIDAGLLKNRVNIEMDVYYKKTTNMLLGSPLPESGGYSVFTKNVGSVSNRGFEISIKTLNLSVRNFTWETTFNLSFNKNEVLALGDEDDDIFPGPDILSASNNIIRVGEPVGSFYGYRRLGTWGSHEADEAAKYGKLPGDIKLWDKNGDYQNNDMDRVIIGKGIPDGYGSLYNTFRYGNLDLSVDIQYMFGNDVLDISKHSAEDRTGSANSYRTVLNAWTPENQHTMIAQIRPAGARYTSNIDSHFVEDGSFVRGRNLLLGYTFPSRLTGRLGVKHLRLYGSVQNFFLISAYTGYDPEVSDASQTFAQGITVFGYPKPRTFTFGLNITF
jgi:TonB-linked SusC/RagA family outer membrane protein